MKTYEIKGTLRNEVGKKHTRQIRKAEMYPALSNGKIRTLTSVHMKTVLKNLFIHMSSSGRSESGWSGF
jgi:ribosomal protein L25 (general stress protein Ctc)